MERKRKYCPHCKEYVSPSTFHTHKDLFFRHGSWEHIQEGHDDGQQLIKYEEIMYWRRIGQVLFQVLMK